METVEFDVEDALYEDGSDDSFGDNGETSFQISEVSNTPTFVLTDDQKEAILSDFLPRKPANTTDVESSSSKVDKDTKSDEDVDGESDKELTNSVVEDSVGTSIAPPTPSTPPVPESSTSLEQYPSETTTDINARTPADTGIESLGVDFNRVDTEGAKKTEGDNQPAAAINKSPKAVLTRKNFTDCIADYTECVNSLDEDVMSQVWPLSHFSSTFKSFLACFPKTNCSLELSCFF